MSIINQTVKIKHRCDHCNEEIIDEIDIAGGIKEITGKELQRIGWVGFEHLKIKFFMLPEEEDKIYEINDNSYEFCCLDHLFEFLKLAVLIAPNKNKFKIIDNESVSYSREILNIEKT